MVGLIRNPAHGAEVEETGATAIVCDLESAGVDALSEAVAGSDAVVFAAGAGPGSGAERKLTIDRDGAIKLLEASAANGSRYVIVSSIGAENPPAGDDVFDVYLRAKAAADAAVMASAREWVVIRPGRLTNHPGTGGARIETTPFRGEVSRDDVAAVLAAVLHESRATGHVLYVNGGSEPIEPALAAAVQSRP